MRGILKVYVKILVTVSNTTFKYSTAANDAKIMAQIISLK